MNEPKRRDIVWVTTTNGKRWELSDVESWNIDLDFGQLCTFVCDTRVVFFRANEVVSVNVPRLAENDAPPPRVGNEEDDFSDFWAEEEGLEG